MPRKCCVPGCKSNYNSTSEYVSTFKFPSTAVERERWIQNIPRKDWVPSPSAVVCIKHFEEKDISRVETFKDEHGETKTWNRSRPVIISGAVPRLFEGLPKYLSKPTGSASREAPSWRERYVTRVEDEQAKWCQSDVVSDFTSLKSSFQEKISVDGDFMFKFSDSCVVIFSVCCEHIPKVTASIKVDQQMSVQVCVNGNIISRSDLTWALNSNCKLQYWSQLENLISRYVKNSTTSNVHRSRKESLNFILETFESIGLSPEEDGDRHLLFMYEQIKLSALSKRRYSVNMIMISFLIMHHSYNCYCILRENGLLLLPHPKQIRQLTSNLNISVSSAASNKNFLRIIFERLSERERYISLQLDEIYVQPRLNFKGGKLIGTAENSSSEEARTAQVFLISSLYGHCKEVVSVHPVKNQTSEELLEMTRKMLHLLKEAGFKVLVIVSDNNRVNSKMFSLLTADSNDKHIFRPGPGENIFLTFDFVHVYKNWARNNWIACRDVDKTFVYPPFELGGKDEVRHAKFSDIITLYRKEHGALIKSAPKLNNKSVYPSRLERQKVSLVNNIFDPSTISAVNVAQGAGNGTGEFMGVVKEWWDIVNNRNPIKGIASINDKKLEFLSKFINWLDRWRGVSKKGQCLSAETHAALRQSTLVLLEFTHYSLMVIKMPYVLSSKLHTDYLEQRFSCYRQLSGGNYNVSLCQVLETENKLRVRSVLGFHAARYGNAQFSPEEFLKETEGEVEVLEDNELILNEFDLLEIISKRILITAEEYSGLNYVCGYAVRKALQHLTCDICACSYISDEGSEDEYFKDLDNGGLISPCTSVINVGLHTLAIMMTLTESKYEAIFLRKENHRQILINLVNKIILLDDNLRGIYEDSCFQCNAPNSYFFSRFVKTLSNVFLNNYTKVRNNRLDVAKHSCNKRKYSTIL